MEEEISASVGTRSPRPCYERARREYRQCSCEAGWSSPAPTTCDRAAWLFAVGAVEDDADLFQRDEAATDHFIQAWKDALDAFGVFNHFDDNG